MIHRLDARRRAAGESGFTLIELLVVIIILGILAAVVVFAVGGIGDRGQDSACRIDERTLRTAGEAYFAQNDDYGADPDDFNGADPGTNAPRRTIDENTYVSGGFLSEISSYHNIAVYDNNGAAGEETPAIDVIVADPVCA